MVRLAALAFLFGFVLQAQGQIPGTGIPASVNSPTTDGRQHGIPASVVSPQAPRPGITHPQRTVISSSRRLRPFGTERRRRVLVPVPLFYPAYVYGSDSEAAIADPAVSDADAPQTADDSSTAADEDALRQAYLQGMRDGMSDKTQSRYGQHSMDTARAKTSPQVTAPVPAAPEEQDDSPSTVFVFKDGHRVETRNFAIMGQTLYDFSSSGLQKLQLSDLDRAATLKANDDRGVTVKLP